MRTDKMRLAGAALLALSVSASAAAQAKTDKAAGKAATGSVAMPKTDRVPMATFKELLAKGDVVVIDVRSADAHASGHIPGALSMPEDTLTPAVAEKLKRLGKPIATYCA